MLGACGSGSENDPSIDDAGETTGGDTGGEQNPDIGQDNGTSGGATDGESVPTDSPDIVSNEDLLAESFPVVIYEFIDGLQIKNAWLALSDGSITNDFEGVRTVGVAESQSMNPNQWGAWRRGESDDVIERRLGTTNEFTELSADYPEDNLLPDGCYTNPYGFVVSPWPETGTADASFTTDTLCFNNAGYYSTDASSGLITDGDSGDAFDEGSSGTYSIDDFHITLTANSGDVRVATFANFSDEDSLVQQISIDTIILQDQP